MEVSSNNKHSSINVRQITPGKETDMVRLFIEYKQENFLPTSCNHLMIFVEPQINHSYPDVVFVEYNPEKFSEWNPVRNELTKVDYKILYYICISEELDGADIVSGLGASWKETTQAIEKLYDAKLIRRKSGKWQPYGENLFGTKTIEAVEAKIYKFDEAFKQALQNQTFATESYILSNQQIDLTKKTFINKARKTGIGVYTQCSSNVGFDMILQSRQKEIPVSFSSIFFNEWVGKVIHTQEGRCK